MPDLGADTRTAYCYPSVQQYEKWAEEAERRGYDSTSQFIIDMVEVGYKQMELSVSYDEDARELREQRNDLKRQLDDARDRIEDLEQQLYRSERHSIVEFVEQQPDGATFPEIVQHVVDDAPSRVAEHISKLENDHIILKGDRYTVHE